MPISEFLQQCLNSVTKSKRPEGLRSGKARRTRSAHSSKCVSHAEVFETRALLAAAMTSSVSTDIDDAELAAASVESVERKIGKFIVFNRWSQTATNGSGLTQGDPTTLTWSLPADGVTTDNADNPDAPNNLINFLDTTFGAGTGSDLTQRPWFHIFDKSLSRLEVLSGINYEYVTYDDGVAMRPTNRGVLNQRADVRIMGKNIDDPFNTLAYNGFPHDGDMTIDTSETTFFGNDADDYRAFRNVLMHEFMHGLGVDHVESSDAGILIEPMLETSFDGPQLDDILAMQRSYGDALEKSGGNTFSTAIDLGTVASSSTVSRGTLGDLKVVEATETDFVSIDDESDQDFYKFTVEAAGSVTITLSPRGTTYMVGPENLPGDPVVPQTSFNSKNQSDLTVKLLGEDGVTVLETRNAGALGVNEVIQDFMLTSPGTYYVQVTGATTNKVQLYGLDLSFNRTSGHQFFGTMFDDRNRNGVRDPGEPGVAGIRAYNDSNDNSQYDEGEPSAFSTADGTYTIAGVPSSYFVRAELPPNRQSTMPSGLYVGNGFVPGTDANINGGDFGSIALPVGTAGNDAFVLTYSPDNVTITVSTNGGAASTIGTFPLTEPVTVNGGEGTDSIRIVGTGTGDEFYMDSSTVIVTNMHQVNLTSIEQRTLAGGAGDDFYIFDTDAALGTVTLDEAGGGTDLLDFFLSSLAVSVNLGQSTSQVVNQNLSLILGSTTTFENVEGGSGDDKLTGNSRDNMLSGNDNQDDLVGLGGNDTLKGGKESDLYLFDADTQLGTDTIVEAFSSNPAVEGFDKLDFKLTTQGVVVDLGTTAQQTVNSNLKLILSANNVIDDVDGGAGNDRITGNEVENYLDGYGGNDVLSGLAGHDRLNGMQGDDTYVFTFEEGVDSVQEPASEGIDTFDFSAVPNGVTVDLGTTAAQRLYGSTYFSMSNASAIENVIGGSGNDTITGNALGNNLSGHGGNDTLRGGHGNDILAGGADNDTYLFDPATTSEFDSITESASAGTDTISFATVTADVSINLGLGGAQPVHANRFLTTNGGSAIENITGGSANDLLIGNTLGNLLSGGGGNDRLIGGPGNDDLRGGTGDDQYSFVPTTVHESDSITEVASAGTDTINFSSLTTDVEINLGLAGAQAVHTNRSLTMFGASAIENVISGLGNDTLIGNTLGNSFIGSGGNDKFVPGIGNDSMSGGPGDDTYLFTPVGSPESDSITEAASAGTDMISFFVDAQNVSINLGLAGAQAVHTNRTLTMFGASAIENVTTSQGNDLLIGNTLGNRFTSTGGNDRLIGGGGNDILEGGLGNDTYSFTLASASESDIIYEFAGAGTDLISFYSLATNVNINLGLSTAQTVHLNRQLTLPQGATIENVVGGSAHDTLTGNALNNSLTGGLGNDTYVFLNASSLEVDTVTEAASAGTDTLSFSAISADVLVNLEVNQSQSVHTNRTLTLTNATNFENVIGGSGNDVLIGNSLANRLTGNNGRDILVGNRGGDSLFGGSGEDVLVSGLVNIQAMSTQTVTFTEFYNKLRSEWVKDVVYSTRIFNAYVPQEIQPGKVAYLRPVTTFLIFQQATVSRNVLDDGVRDELTGNEGLDQFFSGALDSILDRISAESIETITAP